MKACGCRITRLGPPPSVRWCRLHARAKKLLEACQAQHDAIDILFARLIVRDKSFVPSRSGAPWAAFRKGHNVLLRLNK
jgi:hypothetical protein